MKSRTAITLFAILLTVVLAVSVTLPEVAGAETESAQAPAAEMVDVLIGFHRPVDAELVELVQDRGGDVYRQYWIVSVVAAHLPAPAAEALAENPAVRYIEPNHRVYVTGATEPVVPWGIDRVFGDEEYSFPTWVNSTGDGIGVAVLDTGIDKDHQDLAGNVVGGTNTLEDAAPNDWADGHGHGTHVAGTIAALDNELVATLPSEDDGTDYYIVGVAPKVNLYAVKVVDDDGLGTTASVVAGIEWAVEQGIPILNMSLGSEDESETLEGACIAAYEAGHLLVSSVGNSGTEDATEDNVTYPARFDSVIAVAASDVTDNRPVFSSTGPAVELIAPGVGVWSTTPGNNHDKWSGASMASPHVAGVAALMWAVEPALSNSSIRNILQGTAEWLDGLVATEQGHGMVRADLAVQELRKWDTDTSTVTFTITAPSYGATLVVVDEDAQPVEGATVRLENGMSGEDSTGADGKVVFENIPRGSYDYTVAKTGYVTVAGEVEVVDDDVTVDVTLEEEPPPPPPPSPVTPEYEVTVTIDGEGSVVPSVGVHVYREGATVTFEATPALGWMFEEWYVDGQPTGVTVSEFTVTVEVDVTVKAVFVEPPVLLPYVEEIVDPDVGGVVEVPGVMTIAIPPGATENPVRVQVQVYSADDPDVADIVGPRTAVGGLIYEIIVTEVLDEDEYGERIREFFRDLILTLLFSPDDVDDPDDLLIHVYDADLGIWVPLPTLVDPVRGEVTVHLDHLPYFAIFEVPDRLTDIEGHWGEADILFLTAADAISGYPDLTFRPEELVDREQFGRMLVGAAGLSVRPVLRLIQLMFDDFDDISEWSRPYVEAAAAHQLVMGFDDDTFRPLDEVTRAQVAVMLSRTLGLTPIGEPPFIDADDIPDWAAGHVTALSEYEIVRGYPANGYEFLPHRQTTRAEAAAFLSRYLDVRLGR